MDPSFYSHDAECLQEGNLPTIAEDNPGHSLVMYW